MNFDFADEINPYLRDLDINNALEIAENKLENLPISNFHSILGLSLLSQVENLVKWINEFYDSVSKQHKIKAIYFEMNEFDINTSVWFISGFVFEEDGGLDLEDMDWLCDYDEETKEYFIIIGYEKLQKAFEEFNIQGVKTPLLQAARDWCEQIIIIRFMELMKEAHLKAKEKGFKWAKIPIYFTEHDYDFVVKSKIKNRK